MVRIWSASTGPEGREVERETWLGITCGPRARRSRLGDSMSSTENQSRPRGASAMGLEGISLCRRSRGRHAGSVAMLMLVALALCPQLSHAASSRKTRVAILQFSGPGGEAIRRALVARIKRRAEVVSADSYEQAANAAGVNGQDPEGIAVVCRSLRCAAIITGKVQKRRRRLTLTVTMYDAASGRILAERRARGRRIRRLLRATRTLARRLVRRLRSARVPEPLPTPPQPATPSWVDGKDSENPLASRANVAVVTKSAEETSARGGPSWIDLSAALGIASRSYELSGSDPAQNSEYDGGVFPEFILGVKAFPLALWYDNALRNLGVGITYSRHLKVSTKLPPEDAKVDTSSQELLLDLRFRAVPFDLGEWSPRVAVFGGWGFRQFKLGANRVLSTFNYGFIRLGGSVAVPLSTPLIGISLGFDIRPLLSVGQEAIDTYGERKGGIGWSFAAGLSGEHPLGLFYFANVQLMGFSADFAGIAEATPTEETPVRAEPTSGSDRFVRFWLGAGYAFR